MPRADRRTPHRDTRVVLVTGLTVLLSGTSLGGCLADISGEEDEVEERSTFSSSQDCDGSSYNCKLPVPPVDRNRIYNHATQSYDWPIAAGAHLRDGLGNIRGVVTEADVRINYGPRKTLAGTSHVYAFATQITCDPSTCTKATTSASGWVRETALTHGPIERMETIAHRNPGQGDYATVWTVTGGDPDAFGDLRVSANYSGEGRRATDYLARPGGVVNLLYNLPGVGGMSLDTFPVNVSFLRARGVNQLEINLYKPGSGVAVRTMKFIYGRIHNRYGWIAKDALAALGSSAPPSPPPSTPPAPPPTPSTTPCAIKCCNQSYVVSQTLDASQCQTLSQTTCQSQGHVQWSQFNNLPLYTAPYQCWGRCQIHDAYHDMAGWYPASSLSSGNCYSTVKSWCQQAGRGGYLGSHWAMCQPTPS